MKQLQNSYLLREVAFHRPGRHPLVDKGPIRQGRLRRDVGIGHGHRDLRAVADHRLRREVNVHHHPNRVERAADMRTHRQRWETRKTDNMKDTVRTEEAQTIKWELQKKGN